MPRFPSRSHAILNSPIVRNHIHPILSTAFTPVYTLPLVTDLISTQPQLSKFTVEAASVVEVEEEGVEEEIIRTNLKRKRKDHDDDTTPRRRSVVASEPMGEVQVSYTAQNLPPELTKYWYQRHRLFSLYDEGCQMDLEGWYSVTPELVATQIAERCRSNVVLDAFCGVGGNAIQFAFTCEKVIAIDISPVRLACAQHNARIYGVEDRITFILADFTQWSKEYVAQVAKGEIATEDLIEVVFLSPPWGGIEYKSIAAVSSTSPSVDHPPSASSKLSFPLSALAPLHGAELFALAQAITPDVAYYLPKNVDLDQVAALSPNRVEIEEEWTGGKLKAVTAYYGSLACDAE